MRVFIVATFLISLPLYAQRGWQLKMGGDISNEFYTNHKQLTQHKYGIEIGIAYEILNWKFLGINTGLGYILKGSKYNEETRHVNYVKIPVDATISYRIKRYGLYSLFGPRFDYLINQPNWVEVKEMEPIDSEDDYGVHYKRFVLGYDIGAGFLIELGTRKVFFEYRYGIDLTLSKKETIIIDPNTVLPQGGVSKQVDGKNEYIEFLVGIGI